MKAAECQCIRCLHDRSDYLALARFIVCQKCGNKRCPHSDWHGNECTKSNEPGQPGSRYASDTPPTPIAKVDPRTIESNFRYFRSDAV